MVTITSQRNPLLQEIKRAAHKGQPSPGGLLVAEGPHLLAETLRGSWAIDQVLVSPAARSRHQALIARVKAPILDVAELVLSAIAGTESTQGIIALLRPRAWDWVELMGATPLIVAVDGVQDPGNVGTIIRSAEAFGATGIVLLKGTAQLANGKTLRATAGSIFRMPYLEGLAIDEFRVLLRDSGVRCFALTAGANEHIAHADFSGPSALVVGNEGSGVSGEMMAHADAVSVPTRGVESLNAGVACSIALYEARRQRSQQ